MIKFMFWNLGENALEQVVARLAHRHELDVIMLAECRTAPDVMLQHLNGGGAENYDYAPGIGCRRVQIFAAFPAHFVAPLSETDRLTIRHLTLPGLKEILLAVTHFPSKFFCDDASQAVECVNLADSIRAAEENVGHSRTVITGDFNMNPFEDGVVSARGLNAVMTRSIAQRGCRTVQGKEYPLFYNPMWGLFGDGTPGPPGTFYYSSSQHREYFWNMFDQVLIRPELMDAFANTDLRILDGDGAQPFLSANGIPDKRNVSDHLPICFGLEL